MIVEQGRRVVKHARHGFTVMAALTWLFVIALFATGIVVGFFILVGWLLL